MEENNVITQQNVETLPASNVGENDGKFAKRKYVKNQKNVRKTDNKKTSKEQMKRDVIEHWNEIFQNDHNNAVNKYLKEHNQKIPTSIDNYSNINTKSYSDFPYAFQYLEELKNQ